MEEYRNIITLSFVGFYMVVCLGIGVWAMKRTSSAKDFFMAGRNVGAIVTALAVFSSSLSGFGFVGGPGLVYSMGLSSIWMIICAGIGYGVSWFLNGKRLRLFAEYFDSISLPDVVTKRYNSTAAGGLIAIAILLGVLGYLATQILAMSAVVQSILQSTQLIPEATMMACVIFSTVFLVIYCVAGGVIASLYTDLVQGTIMVFAAIGIFITTLFVFDGGPTEVVMTLFEDDHESVNAFGTFGIIGCLSWFLLFGLGGAGQPHLITKFMMTKSIEDSKKSMPLAFLTFSIAALLWISIGLVMRALVISGQHPELASADGAAPAFLQFFTHPILAGIVFAALFAAIMSTADAFLNIGSAVLVHDIPKTIIGRPLKNELQMARLATLILASIAAIFSLHTYYNSKELVGILGAFGWGTFASALVPVVAIGFNWKRATSTAACTAIIISLFLNLVLKVFGITIPFGFDGSAFAMIISTLIFLLVSYLGPQDQMDEDLEALIEI